MATASDLLAVPSIVPSEAALVNFPDCADFLDSEEFSDDNVNQLGQEVGNQRDR